MQRYFGKTLSRFLMGLLIGLAIIGCVFAVGLLIGYGISSDMNIFNVFNPDLWHKIMRFIID